MSRASFSQVDCIINFMEKHPDLARSTMKTTLEGRIESKMLWQNISNQLNSLRGVRKTTKGWVKYWTDKKCNIKRLAMKYGNPKTGLPPPKFSERDKKILAIVGFREDYNSLFDARPLKIETAEVSNEPYDEVFLEEEEAEADKSNGQQDIEFVDQPVVDMEERQMAIMEKLVEVMSSQASALSKLADSAQTQARAMEKLAEASQFQALSVQKLCDSFERIGHALYDSSNTIRNIDSTIQRYTLSNAHQ